MSSLHVALIVVTAIAAVTDWRRGVIPNWLTIPVVAVGPSVHLLVHGWSGFWLSIASLAACALPPYLMFRRGAMGGGDVKLFAGVGALAGFSFGIEVQMLSILASIPVGLVLLARRGELLRSCRNVRIGLANLLRPRDAKKPLEQVGRTAVPLGVPVFAATLLLALRTGFPA